MIKPKWQCHEQKASYTKHRSRAVYWSHTPLSWMNSPGLLRGQVPGSWEHGNGIPVPWKAVKSVMSSVTTSFWSWALFYGVSWLVSYPDILNYRLWVVAPCRLVSVNNQSSVSIIRMVTVQTFETLVNLCQSTRRYNPEDSHPHTHRRENLRTYQELTS
jgi:hypothetical protein